LERIHADGLTNDANNWKSAASVVGYATPGFKNSNSIEMVSTTGKVSVEPEIFIPVFGQPDFTEIRYSFEQGGKVANLKILDHQGREVKQLANNETLAAEGFFRWDGERDDGTRARPGYYVVWLEVFDGSGNVDTYRKRVVITARY
jgi:flagellar hook assembly protein FlgD